MPTSDVNQQQLLADDTQVTAAAVMENADTHGDAHDDAHVDERDVRDARDDVNANVDDPESTGAWQLAEADDGIEIGSEEAAATAVIDTAADAMPLVAVADVADAPDVNDSAATASAALDAANAASTAQSHGMYEAMPQQSTGRGGKRRIGLIALAFVAVIALAGGAGWTCATLMHRDTNVGGTTTLVAEDASEGTAEEAIDIDDDGGTEEVSDDEQMKTCASVPDADVTSVSNDDTALVAHMTLQAPSCEDAVFAANGVRFTVKNADNDIVAAAIYDFAEHPVELHNGTADVTLTFTARQYWQPAQQMSEQTLSVVVQHNQSDEPADVESSQAESSNNADAQSAYAGRSVSESDAERYAQLALVRQLADDKNAVLALQTDEDTYPTQLSSKRLDMEIDGHTWTYADIYAQFLQLKAKHANAVLLWAADYYHYTKHGNDADYYVVLSGEEFNSLADAQSWCSTNGYDDVDCLGTALQ